MGFFKKSKRPVTLVQPNPQTRIDIEKSKEANEAAKERAKAVNDHVKDLFEENGFTMKIVLAAHHPKQRVRGR